MVHVSNWLLFNHTIVVTYVMFSIGWCTFPVELEAPKPEWVEKRERIVLFSSPRNISELFFKSIDLVSLLCNLKT